MPVMITRLITAICSLVACLVLAGPVRAQAPSAAPATPTEAPAAAATSAAAPETPSNVTLSGRIETPKGPLGGAVVRLVGTRQTCATNADGLFFFTVSADAGPLTAVAAYNGAAEVPFTMQPGGPLTVVKMAPPKISKAEQKQLNARVKRAHREGKRSLKQLR